MSLFTLKNGKRYRNKVRAIIINQDSEFLLIQPHGYDKNCWTFVGGGVEELEDPFIAILREIKEEIGVEQFISIQQSGIEHTFEFSSAIKEKRKLDYDGQSATIFLIRIDKSTQIQPQKSELADFRWAKLSEIKDLVRVEAQYSLFEKVMGEFAKSLAA